MTDFSSDRASRRAGGIYYTPRELARLLVRDTLRRVWSDDVPRGERSLRILDPACGDGVFLRTAFQALARCYRDWLLRCPDWRFPKQNTPNIQRDKQGRWQLAPEVRLRIARHHLFGLDVDAQAVEATRDGLARLVVPPRTARVSGHSAISEVADQLAANFRQGNALIDGTLIDGTLPAGAASPERTRSSGGAISPLAFDWRREFPHVFLAADAGFDLVIGNPPYVNARLLARTAGVQVKQYLKQHYGCAAGSFDLYVLFLERAYQLLRDGGVCGMIVPNKVATADYARPCRRMLLRQTRIEQIVDLAAADVFPGTGVYPYILIWTKQSAPPSHKVRIRELAADDSWSRGGATRRVLQSTLDAEAGFQLQASLDVEARRPTAPLATLADLHSGTTGFLAESLAERLCDCPRMSREEGFEFIVSGNIDRYAIRLGHVRFMGRRFQRPLVPHGGEVLSEAKQKLFRAAKIVVAGLTRRIEAAWDPGGLALGVQVYAVLPRDDDPHYLLALLNSKLLTYLFRIRFPAKRLSGGFHSINKGQLGRLPMRRIDPLDPRQRQLHDRLAELARQLDRRILPPSVCGGSDDPVPAAAQLEADLDQAVYELYGLNRLEVRRIEAYFADSRHTL